MNRIQTQAQRLWQLLSAPDTGKTYKQAWTVTAQVLKETGLLLWLVICLFLVFFEWFWNFSIKTGSDFREWLNNIERPSPEQIVSEAGKTIVSVGKTSLNATLSQAREQLGFPAPEPAPAVKVTSVKTEIPKAEPPRVEPPKAEPPQAEPPKTVQAPPVDLPVSAVPGPSDPDVEI